MASLRGVVGRLRGDRVNEVASDVAALRSLMLDINHRLHDLDRTVHLTHEVVTSVNETVMTMNHHVLRLADSSEDQRTVLLGLNHDVRSGAEGALPLFLGYAERLRLDTDTAIGAAQVIERQLALLEDRIGAHEATERT